MTCNMSIVWLIGIAFLVTNEIDFVIGTINQTNCDAAREEYNTIRKGCKDIFLVCSTKPFQSCDATRFCSGECREIYHRVKSCDNSSSGQQDLVNLNLLCSPSGRNTTCADLIYSGGQPTENYGYTTPCTTEIFSLSIGQERCLSTCNTSLVTYEGECCVVNAALVGSTPADENIHTDSLWTACEISSPGKCPSPPPPVLPSPSLTTSSTPAASTSPTASASPTVSASPESGGVVHTKADCLLLLTLTTLLCIYYALY